MTRISKRVREEAAHLCAVWASTPEGWYGGSWSPAAIDLYRQAFAKAFGHDVGDYKGPYDIEAHEAAAEAEALLRTGWSPEGAS